MRFKVCVLKYLCNKLRRPRTSNHSQLHFMQLTNFSMFKWMLCYPSAWETSSLYIPKNRISFFFPVTRCCRAIVIACLHHLHHNSTNSILTLWQFKWILQEDFDMRLSLKILWATMTRTSQNKGWQWDEQHVQQLIPIDCPTTSPCVCVQAIGKKGIHK